MPRPIDASSRDPRPTPTESSSGSQRSSQIPNPVAPISQQATVIPDRENVEIVRLSTSVSSAVLKPLTASRVPIISARSSTVAPSAKRPAPSLDTVVGFLVFTSRILAIFDVITCLLGIGPPLA